MPAFVETEIDAKYNVIDDLWITPEILRKLVEGLR